MTEREDFLQAIAADPDDTFIRLVYADWLEEQGDYEEAQRQRKIPEALKWFQNLLQTLNAGCAEGGEITSNDVFDFGRDASELTTEDVEVDQIPNCHRIITAIRDQIPEFWDAWSVVTGSPLPPGVAHKCYYSSGFCCANEVYPDTHVAGPQSEEFLRNQDRFRHEEEEQWMRQVEDCVEADIDQEEFDRIQDELEKDGP